ncbi:MAG: glycosyltransferase [Phycisphaerae bacterium]|jgi:glycosyltransferase involved in cell wall biosynthesis
MRCIVFLYDWRNDIHAPCGGIEGKILSIAYEIAQKGLFEPILVTTSQECTIALRFASLGFKVYPSRMNGLLCVQAVADVEEILKKHDVAIMQSHTFRASIVGRFVRRVHPEIQHVFRVHTHIEGNEIPLWRKKAYHWLDRLTARWVDHFVPISKCLAHELRDASGVCAAKVTVVHNGIPSPGEPDSPMLVTHETLNREIGIVGKIEERKQQHIAVQALAKMRDNGLRVKLHLVGGTNEKYFAQVQNEAKKLDVDGLVVFHGYNSHPFDCLKNVPVIILPSRFEGVPTSLIEGMALRKLVVGTPTGGTAELIQHGVNGFLHRSGDVDTLVRLLEEIFVRSGSEWETMRDAGYNTWRKEFYVDVMMDGLIDVYRNLGLMTDKSKSGEHVIEKSFHSVDIVVIGYNEAKLLRETLESALIAATRFREEGNPEPRIVYVDGQSTDNSVDIARSMNIEARVVDDIPTASKGRAIGTSLCHGEYIMFLDGDTLLAPDWLLVAVPYLEVNPLVAGVGGRLDWRTLRDGRVIATMNNYWNTRSDGEQVTDGVGGNFLYKRVILDQVGGWNRGLERNEEFELYLRFTRWGYKLRRLVTLMGVHRDDKTRSPKGFLHRYILTPRIFDAGRLTRNAPFSLATLNILFRRYWLHVLHPMLVVIIAGYVFAAWQSGRSLFLALAAFVACFLFLCHLVFKGFHIKRATVSLITMSFFSFGWYVGFFLKRDIMITKEQEQFNNL